MAKTKKKVPVKKERPAQTTKSKTEKIPIHTGQTRAFRSLDTGSHHFY